MIGVLGEFCPIIKTLLNKIEDQVGRGSGENYTEGGDERLSGVWCESKVQAQSKNSMEGESRSSMWIESRNSLQGKKRAGIRVKGLKGMG